MTTKGDKFGSDAFIRVDQMYSWDRLDRFEINHCHNPDCKRYNILCQNSVKMNNF